MPANGADTTGWMITRLELKAWRNFHKSVALDLQARAFFIGPNAVGKSNVLDALRFLRDVASDGLAKAVNKRGGMREIKARNSRNFKGVRIAVNIGTEAVPALWRYELQFRGLPEVERECVWHKGRQVLKSTHPKQGNFDRELFMQTHLEQVSGNRKFREIAAFLKNIRYLHLVPQLVRDPERFKTQKDDPFGSDLLHRMARTSKRIRMRRLKKIHNSLGIAVPDLGEMDLKQDGSTGRWHLAVKHKSWRPKAIEQDEASLSDGTLRLLGLLWALSEEGAGPLLLEEPELSLHSRLLFNLPGIMAKVHRVLGRQILITTHSEALLQDEGIDLREVHLLVPGKDGTTVRTGTSFKEVCELVKNGVSPGEALMPYAAPERASQLTLDI